MRIRSLVLANFMCHEHLHVEFGPHITFIVGQNGSGKSAIVAALMVVFGLSAAKTQRGSRLSTLIREGETAFTLAVQLSNDDEEAFQHARFGPSITIERRVTVDGTSTFRLRDAQQRAVAVERPRETVREISAHFRLQMDNPLAILTQEVVKRYLATSQPAERYELVMRGSQLHRLATDYEATEGSVGVMRERLATAADRIAVQEQRLQETRQQIEAIKEARAILSKLATARRQLAAARQRELCSAIAAKQLEISAAEQKGVCIEEQMHQKNLELASLEERQRGLKAEMEELSASSLSSVRLRAAQIESQLGILATQIGNLNADEHVLHQGRSQLARDSLEHQEKTREETKLQDTDLCLDADPVDLEAEVRARQTALDALGLRHSMLETQLREREGGLEGLGEQETRLATSLRMAREQTERMEREAVASRAALSTAAQGENSATILRFGAPMAALIRHIDAEKMEGVVGPLGCFVRLRPETAWAATALDAIIGRHMSSFVVATYAQRASLAQLMRRHGVANAHIVLLPRSNHASKGLLNIDASTAGRSPGTAVLTARGALEIASDDAERALYILASIHRIALCREREEAVQLLQTPGMRASIDTAFLATGQKVTLSKSAQTFFSFGGGGRWFASIAASRTKEDAEGELAELEARIAARRRSMAQLSAELGTVRRDVLQCTADVEGLRGQLREMGIEHSSLLAALRAAAVQRELVDDAKIVPWRMDEEDAGRMRRRIAIVDAQLEDISAKRVELRQREEALQHQQHDTAKEIQGMENRIRHFADSLSVLESEQRHLRTSVIDELSQQLRDCRRAVEQAGAALCSLQQQGNAGENLSNGLGANVLNDFEAHDGSGKPATEHVDVRPDANAAGDEALSVEAALCAVRRLEAAVEAQRRAHGSSTAALAADSERLLGELRESSQALTSSQHDAAAYADLVARLERSLGERRIRWAAFRDIICRRADIHFRMFLAARSFCGQLLFDHDAGVLQISVDGRDAGGGAASPSSGNGRRMASDLRGLSGGEKSLVTASLLLALWECVESPLRALDEFDVFMDGINRRTILRMLLEYAAKNK